MTDVPSQTGTAPVLSTQLCAQSGVAMTAPDTAAKQNPRTKEIVTNRNPSPVGRMIGRWLELRAEIAEIERAEHPDLRDGQGRVWQWLAGNLYRHAPCTVPTCNHVLKALDGAFAWTVDMLPEPVGLKP